MLQVPGSTHLGRSLFHAYLTVVIAWFCNLFLPWNAWLTHLTSLFDAGNSHWAAWVQALGAVLAIAFGIWYPERRIASERREHTNREVLKLRSLNIDVMQTMSEVCMQVQRGELRKPEIDESTLLLWREQFAGIDASAFRGELLDAHTILQAAIREAAHKMRVGPSTGLSVTQVMNNKSFLMLMVSAATRRYLDDAGVYGP